MVEEHHGIEVSDPVVAGPFFSVNITIGNLTTDVDEFFVSPLFFAVNRLLVLQ